MASNSDREEDLRAKGFNVVSITSLQVVKGKKIQRQKSGTSMMNLLAQIKISKTG